MSKHRILLLGSGGRECAIAWKLNQSSKLDKLFIAPGNGGTDAYGENVALNPLDFEAVKAFCLDNTIDILIPGSEAPLVSGIWDAFQYDAKTKHIIVVGPSKTAAQLEGSKAYAKAFMERHNIPTAQYKEFNSDNFEEGLNYIKQHHLPIVLKADGLAAGKGVIIAMSHEEALTAFTEMIQEAKFGDASKHVVIESFLDGIEMSVFALTDGDHYVILPEAKDYKRIGEGDKGLNTGGMGAISPVPFADKAFLDIVDQQIIKPTVEGLKADNIIYQGFIFFGLIKVNGLPMVIEYNCRMGDPETEVVMPRLKNDLIELIEHLPNRTLHTVQVEHEARAACTVIDVAAGYPEQYPKGMLIEGINDVTQSLVFHAGTKIDNGQVIANGGRLLAITSYGPTIQDALRQSYDSLSLIQHEHQYYRKDIGYEFAE